MSNANGSTGRIVWWIMGLMSAALVGLAGGFAGSRASKDALDANTKALEKLDGRVTLIAARVVTVEALTSMADRIGSLERNQGGMNGEWRRELSEAKGEMKTDLREVEARLSKQIQTVDERIRGLLPRGRDEGT